MIAAAGTRTLIDVVRMSARYLAGHGSESPRLDAELLAAHALGLRRLDLYLQFDRPLAAEELSAVRKLVRRRALAEPVAYILGVREFYGRSFRVMPSVLIPRPDTETLVEAVLRWARAVAGQDGDGLRLADVGTGSGCIGVSLAAELPGARLVASDVDPEALAVARTNADALGVGRRIVLVEGSWGVPLEAHAPFDAVISNPPYLSAADVAAAPATVRDFEPRLALAGGLDGLDAYRELLTGCSDLIRAPGLIAVEVDHRRAETVSRILLAALPGAAVAVVPDLSGRPRVVEAVLA